MPNHSRREFALGAGAALIGESLPQFASAQTTLSSKTRLILLGTSGGPRPRKTRFPSSQVILVNNVPYVFDCGLGVAIQLTRAGVPLNSLRHVFITHQH